MIMSNWIHFSLPHFQVPGFLRCGWAGIIFCLAAAPGTSLEAQHFDCILLNDENTNIFMAPDACFTKENIEDTLTNLYIKESQSKMFGVAKGGE